MWVPLFAGYAIHWVRLTSKAIRGGRWWLWYLERFRDGVSLVVWMSDLRSENYVLDRKKWIYYCWECKGTSKRNGKERKNLPWVEITCYWKYQNGLQKAKEAAIFVCVWLDFWSWVTSGRDLCFLREIPWSLKNHKNSSK